MSHFYVYKYTYTLNGGKAGGLLLIFCHGLLYYNIISFFYFIFYHSTFMYIFFVSTVSLEKLS